MNDKEVYLVIRLAKLLLGANADTFTNKAINAKTKSV